MTWAEAYNMPPEELIKCWNDWCIENDREKLVVYTMADWRKEVDYRHTITWFLDRLDPDRFDPRHEFVCFDTCDDVWLSSDDIFELVDVWLMGIND